MKHNDQTVFNGDRSRAALWSARWIKLSILGAAFVAMLAAVFIISNRMAATMSVGFPNFQDSSFELLDQRGNLRRPDDFLGQPIALFFGFTFCPDVCPTTLMQIELAKDQLAQSEKTADDLQVLFITIDPKRDTPSQLNAYLSLFDANVTGLTGSDSNIAETLQHFGVYAKKIGNDDDYLYDHGAAVYLYRSDGNFKGTIVHNEPMEVSVEKLRSILR